jgi:hypothetical protein
MRIEDLREATSDYCCMETLMENHWSALLDVVSLLENMVERVENRDCRLALKAALKRLEEIK